MIKKIVIARHYGFCMGVKRAIKIADETARESSGPVTILNEIVHNDAVVDDFRRKGVGQEFSVGDVISGTLIISAHGVAPGVKQAARDKGLTVVDATCPLVTNIYKIIGRAIPQGFYLIHFGDPDHDETQGVVGHAPDRITVISSITELDDYPDWRDRKLGLTVQTTMRIEDFEVFRLAAEKKWPHLVTFDTICMATSERQSAIRDMAPEVDMILVVGSQTSANSKRLAHISQALCGRGELIGSVDDIRDDWFTGAGDSIERVGVTAGASTPDFLVDAVIEQLREISGGRAEVVRQPKPPKKRLVPQSAVPGAANHTKA
jgi:4-hydroxy-3-methylbut-2-enyl diphosphate reductase